jgi:hypothetical protein
MTHDAVLQPQPQAMWVTVEIPPGWVGVSFRVHQPTQRRNVRIGEEDVGVAEVREPADLSPPDTR